MSNKTNAVNCGKVKNACKYCLQQVNNKNGLRCQGACKKWAHFKCLNYTPGKISDIKAGLIKVACPCPDCDTTQVKEYLVNPPYSCSNNKCPANSTGPVKCDSIDCPVNKNSGSFLCSNKACSDDAAESRDESFHQILPACPPITPLCSGSPGPRSVRPQKKKKRSAASSNSSDSCGQCPPSPDKCGGGLKTEEIMMNAVQDMCGTVGMLSVQLRDLMKKLKKMV